MQDGWLNMHRPSFVLLEPVPAHLRPFVVRHRPATVRRDVVPTGHLQVEVGRGHRASTDVQFAGADFRGPWSQKYQVCGTVFSETGIQGSLIAA